MDTPLPRKAHPIDVSDDESLLVAPSMTLITPPRSATMNCGRASQDQAYVDERAARVQEARGDSIEPAYDDQGDHGRRR